MFIVIGGTKGVENMNYKMPWEEDCGQTFVSATVEGYLYVEKLLKNKRS